MTNKAVIIGYSGHSYVVIDTLLTNGYQVLSYCEAHKKAENPYQLAYLGDEKEMQVIEKLKSMSAFIGVGENAIRENIYKYLTANEINCPYVIHKSACVSALSEISDATVIMPGAVVNAKSIIGKAVICNSSSVIEHECVIGDYSHVAPGAVLAGNVRIGKNTFVGANSVIKEGIIIGSNVIIGAGSVVVKDIADGALVYGNPARIY